MTRTADLDVQIIRLVANMDRESQQERLQRARALATLRADERLLDEALAQWVEWLITFVLPPKRAAVTASAIADTWATAERRARASGKHSDPTLAGLIRDESQGWGWATTVHLCVMEMKKPYRVALFGTALGYSQQTVASQTGLRQQEVSTLLRDARTLLLRALKPREHVRHSRENAARKKRFAAA